MSRQAGPSILLSVLIVCFFAVALFKPRPSAHTNEAAPLFSAEAPSWLCCSTLSSSRYALGFCATARRSKPQARERPRPKHQSRLILMHLDRRSRLLCPGKPSRMSRLGSTARSTWPTRSGEPIAMPYRSEIRPCRPECCCALPTFRRFKLKRRSGSRRHHRP